MPLRPDRLKGGPGQLSGCVGPQENIHTAFGIALDLRLQEGYDQSYYFIASFMAEHMHYHARFLK